MSKLISVEIELLVEVKEESPEAKVREEIESAMNSACSFLEGSEIRDPDCAGVSYKLNVKEI